MGKRSGKELGLKTPNAKKMKLSRLQEHDEVFADPTYDFTFKMLFGNEANKDILISVLNGLLNFRGNEQIKDVSIISNELTSDGVSDIKSSVDVLCVTKNHKKIAVEMQRQYKAYFLPRSQEYMSKLIIGQVKDGQGGKYDKVLMDTYVLCIGKQNIFCGTYALPKSTPESYEKTVVPMIKECGIEVPGNRMHWKFYELPKFAREFKSKNITSRDPIKHQWLDFLVKCTKQTELPHDVDDIIKKGYKIMEVANWSEDQRTLYWKMKSNEENDLREAEIARQETENLIKETAIKNREAGLEDGKKIGEIQTISTLLELGIAQDKIKGKLQFFGEQLGDIEKYILSGHQNDSPQEIAKALDLISEEEAVVLGDSMLNLENFDASDI